MTEAEWLAGTDARDMLEQFDLGNLSDRKLRLFAVACCRCSRQLLLDKELRDALVVSFRYAEGQATAKELAVTHNRINNRAITMFGSERERETRRWAEATAVARSLAGTTSDIGMIVHASDAVWMIDRAAHTDPSRRLADLLREIMGNPYRPLSLDPLWRTSVVLNLAQAAYIEWTLPAGTLDPDRLAVLADALEDAGCDNADILNHLRGPGPHVRGCWALDLVLNKT